MQANFVRPHYGICLNPDPTAALFQHYICREESYLNFFRELGKGEEQSKKFCESAEGSGIIRTAI